MKLKDIGEFGFIDEIAPLGHIRSEGVVKGIGDDCAVIEIPGPDHLLVTTDLLVEHVHFRRGWGTPEQLGWKALSVNLSDIAACGGRPRDAFIGIAIPEEIEVEWLERLYRGLAHSAADHGVNILGGDTTRSESGLVISIAVTGLVPRAEVLFRHTAQPGDAVILTGPTGESAAGCRLLLSESRIPKEVAAALVKAHLEPRAHLGEGRILAMSGACTAAIDVSDGISSDLGHLCRDSGFGAIVYEESLPVTPGLATAGELVGEDPLNWILNGGEDYVLLAAVRSDAVEALRDRFTASGSQFFVIGEFVAGGGMSIRARDGSTRQLLSRGWDHFR